MSVENSAGGESGPHVSEGNPVSGRGGRFRSHLIPRTKPGWVAVVLFLGLFALVEPPFVTSLANRIEPWLLGFPFLYTYLLVLYSLLIGVLIWALRRNL